MTDKPTIEEVLRETSKLLLHVSADCLGEAGSRLVQRSPNGQSSPDLVNARHLTELADLCLRVRRECINVEEALNEPF